MSASGGRAARELTVSEASHGVWDLVVIGAGSAGLVASRTAAVLGARVLLIEAGELGGECLHSGCVPSKALIASAHAAQGARAAARLGVDADVTVDFARVMAHVRSAIATIEPTDSVVSLASDGVFVLRGRARFAEADQLEVDGTRIRFRDAIVATGSRPVIAAIDGIDGVDVLTNDTFFTQETLPARLLVQGGGAIGCELAQAMARLGSSVTLVHRGPRLLPKEEPAASAVILAAFESDGVDVHLGAEIVSLRADAADGSVSGGGTARLSDGSEVGFDRMLVALGRRVDTSGLGLEAIGVAVDEHGAIAVDQTLGTSNPRIRAAGDVTPLPRFTHTAGTYGSVAATNAVLGLSRKADTDVVPRVTFTSPEVGAVGVAPQDAERLGMRALVRDHAHVDRAVAEDDTTGRTTVVVDAKGRVRGASIVGPRAGESLAEMTTAMRAGLTARQLATTIHAYPTYSDAGWNAVVGEAQRSVRAGLTGRVVDVLRRVHRRRG